MDIFSMLKALHEQKAAIEEAIRALSRLNTEERKNRRGRPPKWLQAQQGERESSAKDAEESETPASRPESPSKPGRPRRRGKSPSEEDLVEQESAA